MAEIKSLLDAKGEQVCPKTVSDAIYHKDKTLTEVLETGVYLGDDDTFEDADTAIDADTLQGYAPDHFATYGEVQQLTKELSTLTKTIGNTVDLIDDVTGDKVTLGVSNGWLYYEINKMEV